VSNASKFSLGLLVTVILTGCLNSSRFSSFEPNADNRSVRSTAGLALASQSVANPNFYLVKPGDTLYSIAFRFGLDYQRLAQKNAIGVDYRIYEGQSLTLKESAEPSKTPAARPVTITKKGTVPDKPVITKNNSQTNGVTPVLKKSLETKQIAWVWPHKGKIVRTFIAKSSSNKGIDIGGQIGDSVLAATSGTVVYAGNGLPGYGNLIIIEHPNALLSAYAFAEQILVKEKDRVQVGQQIATMGKQGDQPSLHFEIRQNGKPVDPLGMLPRR
jgi:lipoprotein NlpD